MKKTPLSKKKSPKGSVGVEVFQGRLRLRLPRHLFEGKQKYLTLGLSDSKETRKLADAKAKQIEADIAYERFDFTLSSYKLQVGDSEVQKNEPEKLDLVKLWERYVNYRKPQVSLSTVANQYAAVTSHLNKIPDTSVEKAAEVRDWLINQLTLDAAKRTLVQLNACCKWAMKSKILPCNPFDGMANEIKVRKANLDGINPFTPLERQAIIEAFSNTPYSLLVKFLFLTGCRTGEAVGLKWKYISVDCRYITFAESLSGQKRFVTDTKTHKSRKFPCNKQLQTLLREIKPNQPSPEALVFDIGPIRTFQDHWKKRVKALVSEGKLESYRSQYNTRHTFITNCLEAGVSVVQIAKWAGNSPEIIMKHYAGIIKQVEVPEF